MQGQPPQSGSPSVLPIWHVAEPTSIISPPEPEDSMQVISQFLRSLQRQFSPLHDAVFMHCGASFVGSSGLMEQL